MLKTLNSRWGRLYSGFICAAFLFSFISNFQVNAQERAQRADRAQRTDSVARGPERWENSIKAFEEKDKTAKPAEGGILFMGSSSIVRWDVQKSFPNLPVTNRGFGGSQIADSVAYVDRIGIPHKPAVIVFYAGDNDLAGGKTPEQVLNDFKALEGKVHAALPSTRLIFISIKPSLARWNIVGKIRESNTMIKKFCELDQRMVYLDIEPGMLGADGKPKPELFVEDGLHMTEKGYEVWNAMVQPILDSSMAAKGSLPSTAKGAKAHH